MIAYSAVTSIVVMILLTVSKWQHLYLSCRFEILRLGCTENLGIRGHMLRVNTSYFETKCVQIYLIQES